jgi:outer membrane immunogenic protein
MGDVMKKLLLATMAAAAFAMPAQAADMPVKAPPRVAPPVLFSWTGCYIGAQVGGQWGRDREREFVTGTGVFTGTEFRFNSRGVVGGGHLGCTWQASAFVFGLEVDVEGAGVRGSFRFPNGDGTDFRSNFQGSFRGRLGWAMDRTLLYATGGLAWARLRYIDITPGIAESHSQIKAGWTVGGGIEQAFWSNWTARIEYRFTDYGTERHASTVAFPGFSYEHEPNSHSVRAYLTYRWGGGAVVARY